MQVIRLEYPSTGNGPYGMLHANPKEQPAMSYGSGFQPCFSRGSLHPPHWKYGFISKEQAEAWWDEDARKSAERAGYMLAVYDVPADSVDFDRHQCVFDPQVASLVAHIPPSEWLAGRLNLHLQAAAQNAHS